jgi:hypothetical protein
MFQYIHDKCWTLTAVFLKLWSAYHWSPAVQQMAGNITWCTGKFIIIVDRITALRFTVTGAPPAARSIRILPMNQHAWRSIIFGIKRRCEFVVHVTTLCFAVSNAVYPWVLVTICQQLEAVISSICSQLQLVISVPLLCSVLQSNVYFYMTPMADTDPLQRVGKSFNENFEMRYFPGGKQFAILWTNLSTRLLTHRKQEHEHRVLTENTIQEPSLNILLENHWNVWLQRLECQGLIQEGGNTSVEAQTL